MSKHALTRTSPKGEPFLGTCLQCGATALPSSAIREECVNPAGFSEDEALLLALDQGEQPKDPSNV